MNYIKLINWFWDEAIYYENYKAEYGILFLAIIDSINNNQWNEVEINYDRIINKTKLSKRAYLEARNWLQENKLIDFVAGKNEYSRAKFSIGIAVQNCTSTAPLPDHNSTATSTSTAPSIINIETEETKKQKIIKHLKQFVRENVSLTNDEVEKLLQEYGDEKSQWMFNELSLYKHSSGKKYKSDYHAILTWVVGKLQTHYKKSTTNQHTKTLPKPSLYHQANHYYQACQREGIRPVRWEDDKELTDEELEEEYKRNKFGKYVGY